MKHAREDYQHRIVDAAGRIPDDEPVFLLRGQDMFAAPAILFWADLVERADGQPELIEAARNHAAAMQRWQVDHGGKKPDMPPPFTPSAMAGAPSVEVWYVNYRGEPARRQITPLYPWFGATEWHPTPQWLLAVWDHEKAARRDFALTDIGFAPKAALEAEAAAGYVIANGAGDRWRALNGFGMPTWTAELSEAFRCARREDAEAMAREDEDAWRILSYAEAQRETARRAAAEQRDQQ